MGINGLSGQSGLSGLINNSASANTPALMTNLGLWFRADAGTYQDAGLTTPATSNGNPVLGWVSQAGGNSATQATSGNAFTLVTGAINGNPALQPAGATCSLNLSTPVTFGNNPGGQTEFTAYFVIKYAVSNSYPGFCENGSDFLTLMYGANNLIYLKMFGASSINVAFTGDTGWIAVRVRLDSNANGWAASSGMAEAQMSSTANGNITLATLFYDEGDGVYISSTAQVAEMWYTSVDSVTNGDDATIALPYLHTKYNLAIP